MSKTIFTAALILSLGFLIMSCDDEDEVYSPKPRGYVRIDFPEKSYEPFQSACPFSFEIPTYSKMKLNTSNKAEPCWYNLEFPQFKATLHLSYKPINKNLAKYLDDAH